MVPAGGGVWYIETRCLSCVVAEADNSNTRFNPFLPHPHSVTEVDAQGKPVTETNVIPFKNTTALIRDLTPGKTYEVGVQTCKREDLLGSALSVHTVDQLGPSIITCIHYILPPKFQMQFNVQSYSTAYDGGRSARTVFTVPRTFVRPSYAPSYAPGNLQTRIYGGEVQVGRRSLSLVALVAITATFIPPFPHRTQPNATTNRRPPAALLGRRPRRQPLHSLPLRRLLRPQPRRPVHHQPELAVAAGAAPGPGG
jgi:hypothetical protein